MSAVAIKEDPTKLPKGTLVTVNGVQVMLTSDVHVDRPAFTGEGPYLEDSEKGWPRLRKEEAVKAVIEDITPEVTAAPPALLAEEEAKEDKKVREAAEKAAAERNRRVDPTADSLALHPPTAEQKKIAKISGDKPAEEAADDKASAKKSAEKAKDK